MENKTEEHIYDKNIKLKFMGQGEWIDECDKMHFTYKGYECRILRNFVKEPYCKEEAYFGGYLCGYVKFNKELLNEDEINCHGGITFCENSWIGFDCSHSTDYVPTMEEFKKRYANEILPIPEEFKQYSLFNPVYRNMEFCIEECKQIVEQVIKLEANDKIKNNEMSAL